MKASGKPGRGIATPYQIGREAMRLRAHSLLLEGNAELSTDHAASSYGQPVLLIEGEPIGPFEAALGRLRRGELI